MQQLHIEKHQNSTQKQRRGWVGGFVLFLTLWWGTEDCQVEAVFSVCVVFRRGRLKFSFCATNNVVSSTLFCKKKTRKCSLLPK